MPSRIAIAHTHDPHLNLAREQAFIDTCAPDTALLYLWQNKNTVVIGAGQNAWRECRTQLLEQEGGTLARRSSGGGAVYHDLGNLNFSFIVPREMFDVERQLTCILRAVRSLGIDAQFSGRNDIVTADGRKFSGNAFRKTGGIWLHHGTLLVNVDVSRMARYLSPPAEKMRAKGVASVPARVVNLCELASFRISDLADALCESFCDTYEPCAREAVDDARIPELARLRAHFAGWEWVYGRTPSFDVRLEKRFPWGGVELLLSVEAGTVIACDAYTDAMDPELAGALSRALSGRQLSPGALGTDVTGSAELSDVGEWLRGVQL